MRRPLLFCVPALAALLLSGGAPAPAEPRTAERTALPAAALPAPTTTHHFVANLHGAAAEPRRTGFNIFDTGSSSQQVDALPTGVRAMVWLGQKCPTVADAAFRSTVQRLATDPRVFGYYLSDEPHVADCPQGALALASRAGYIRQVTGGKQRSFIVLSKPEDYPAFRPRISLVDMVGIDPYPCSVPNPGCAFDKIDEKVALATRSIALSHIVPVYQAFGQSAAESNYYTLPTAAQMSTMLAHWARLVPHPKMDYAYGWGHQTSANPTLTDSAPLKSLFSSYFAG
ncbi:MAG: hypothetical protein QOF53_3239 [Nocardioidaceae bacterium]|nr:hypothetical protein [Nocardioidaceae bacterium]